MVNEIITDGIFTTHYWKVIFRILSNPVRNQRFLNGTNGVDIGDHFPLKLEYVFTEKWGHNLKKETIE